MVALVLLCAANISASDCDKDTAVRWWSGDPCQLPSACLTLAVERGAKAGVVARNGEHWKFTYERSPQ